jgi:signal transduction histidine kinase
MNIEDFPTTQAFLQNGGRCGKLMRLMDWRKTTLGSPDTWPPELRTVINLCLQANLPMIIWWSKESVTLYNDHAIRLLHQHHPEAMGKPGQNVLPKMHDTIRSVFKTGESANIENERLIISHDGNREESYFSSYHCPINNEKGKTVAVLSTFLETTQVVVEKRLSETLLQLNLGLTSSDSFAKLYESLSKVFQSNPYDFPFFIIYEVDNFTGNLKSASTGLSPDVAPKQIDLNNSESVWPLNQALDSNNHVLVHNDSTFKKLLPHGTSQDSPEKALLFPIKLANAPSAVIVLIFGINPCCVLNESFMNFLGLLVEQIAERIGIIEREVLTVLVSRNQSAQAEEQIEHLRHISNHELQEPLRKIRTFTNLLQRELIHDSKAIKQLEKIDDAADYMSTLIQNVCNYPVSPDISASAQHTDLTAALESALDELTDVIKHQKAVIKYGALPHIYGVSNQLVTLFKHLLQNSLNIRKTPATIVIEAHRVSMKKNNVKRDYVELIYTDNSSGLDQGVLIFQKIEGHKVQDHIAGIAECRKIVSQHGGSIEVSSSVNRGTIAKIILPIENDGAKHPPN